MQSKQWREAMAAAKVAVRAYARDASSSNAAEVELAWHRVRRLDSVARWRRPNTEHPAEPEPAREAPKVRQPAPTHGRLAGSITHRDEVHDATCMCGAHR